MITVKFVFSLQNVKIQEFFKTKRVFRSVFLGGSVKIILRVKRSFEVILAISGHFCKIEKAHIGAMVWTAIDSALTPSINPKKISPKTKKIFKIKVKRNHASYTIVNYTILS